MNNNFRAVLAGAFLWLTATGALAAFTSGGHLLGFWSATAGGCGAVGATYLNAGSVGQTSPGTASAQNLGTPCDTRVIAVAVGLIDDDGAAVNVSAVTIGGVSATNRVEANVNSSMDYEISWWTAVVPTGTTGDIVITWSGAVEDNVVVGAWRVISVSDSDGVPSDTDGSTAADDAIDAVTIPSGGVGLFACQTVEEGGGISMANAGTERYDIDQGTDGGSTGYDSVTAGTPNVTCTNSAGLSEISAGMAFGP